MKLWNDAAKCVNHSQVNNWSPANFQAVGYAVLIEDDPNQKYTSTGETYALIVYSSKNYIPSQNETSIYAKEFYTIYLAFKDFRHVFWEHSSQWLSWQTVNQEPTFSNKNGSSTVKECLWFCIAIQYHHSTHSGKMSTPADFQTRLQISPIGKTFWKTREVISTKPIKVIIESAGTAQKEPVFFDTTDRQKTAEREPWKRREIISRAIPTGPPVITVPCHYANDLHKETTIVSIAQLTKPWRILIEQVSDPTLLICGREILGPPVDERIVIKDACYMHYFWNK